MFQRSHMLDPQAEVSQTVLGSGVLGFRAFWKLSSVSSAFLALRNDSSFLGFGSVCRGFDAVTEREEVWNLIDDCLKRSDNATLAQLFALNGVALRYPFLLKRFLEKERGSSSSPPSHPPNNPPNAQHFVRFLTENAATPCCADLSLEGMGNLTKERLEVLLETGAVDPDSWVCSGPQGASGCVVPSVRPLLIALIDAHKWECVQLLLQWKGRGKEKGVRVDVNEWMATEKEPPGGGQSARFVFPYEYSVAGRTPLHALVVAALEQSVARKGEGGGDERPLGVGAEGGEGGRDGGDVEVELLRCIAHKAKETGTLQWTVRPEACSPLFKAYTESPFESEMMQDTELTAVELACLAGEAELLRALLQLQPVVTETMPQPRDSRLPMIALTGAWVLPHVSDAQCVSVLKVLAEGGADFKRAALGDGGHSPLSLACSLELEESAEFLLSQGVAVGGVEWKVGGLTLCKVPLVEAVLPFISLPVSDYDEESDTTHLQVEPSVSLAALLLRNGADPNKIGLMGKGGDSGKQISALFLALVALCCHGQSPTVPQLETEGGQMVKLLVDYGAKCVPANTLPDASPIASEVYPLHVACVVGDLELLRLLCEKAGADPNRAGRVAQEDERVDYPISMLIDSPRLAAPGSVHCASMKRRDELAAKRVEILADLGADLNKRKLKDGHTPLSKACSLGMVKTVKALVTRGAALGGEGGRKRLPLIEAAVSDHPLVTERVCLDLLSFLLQAGADPNEVGLLRRENLAFSPSRFRRSPWVIERKDCRASALQALAYTGMGRDEVMSRARLLVDHGARCPSVSSQSQQPQSSHPQSLPRGSRDPGPSAQEGKAGGGEKEEEEEEKGHKGGAEEDSGPLAPLSRISLLLTASKDRDAGLVRMLCERGGGDPNDASGTLLSEDTDSEVSFGACPLALTLLDRSAEKLDNGRYRQLKPSERQSRLQESLETAQTLLEVGADASLLASKWPSEHTPVWGSGSWLVDLMNFVHEKDEDNGRQSKWDPLLLEVIRSVPLSELEEPTFDRDHLKSTIFPGLQDMPMRPLQAAADLRWRAGETALQERGVTPLSCFRPMLYHSVTVSVTVTLRQKY
uniref:Uncharacterized protein n=1 Tax=Chromera velia CCMP2878 TaxID=1169474 RepID=A0A0G4I1J9_9ALVE|eukprot:Cvel_10156.t1-p1 / transcript=Cvel_10156.t1 / gene=Cvel_10156 / organism=Chromera_velia_CCMP2878 / gene_product=Ankyrin repeat and SOCS box protein 10, putative / transcript_product=Ankyrin repeat and SOCS box protein 10, putative / location=Cvel_scaffold606:8761-12786(+) / protein_length=1092 / sequence_SO=supercontig / SO=protein_coding / is_pseudo=false